MHSGSSLPAARGGRVRRPYRRQLRAIQDCRGEERCRDNRLLRRAFHGRVGRHPHRRTIRKSTCPIRSPDVPWPTWRRWPMSWRHGSISKPFGGAEQIMPISYMNTAAGLKAFTGRNGGLICTSSNADAAHQMGAGATGESVLLPGSASRLQHRDQVRFAAGADGDLGFLAR